MIKQDLAEALRKEMREQQSIALQFNQQWRTATAWQHRKESK